MQNERKFLLDIRFAMDTFIYCTPLANLGEN